MEGKRDEVGREKGRNTQCDTKIYSDSILAFPVVHSVHHTHTTEGLALILSIQSGRNGGEKYPFVYFCREKELRRQQRYCDKSHYEHGVWNVNTVMMGGLGGDPDLSSASDEGILKCSPTTTLDRLAVHICQLCTLDRLCTFASCGAQCTRMYVHNVPIIVGIIRKK